MESCSAFGRDETRSSGSPKIAIRSTALAVDPEGETVVALRQAGRGIGMSYAVKQPDGSYRSRPDDHIPSLSTSWLTPILTRGVERLVGLGDGSDMMFVDAASGMHWGRLTIAADSTEHPQTAFLLPLGSPSGIAASRLAVLTHNGPHWVVLDIHGKILHRIPYHWQPAIPGLSPLRSVPTTFRHAPPFLDLVGLDKEGAVSSAQFQVEHGVFELLACASPRRRGDTWRRPAAARTWSSPWDRRGPFGSASAPIGFTWLTNWI